MIFGAGGAVCKYKIYELESRPSTRNFNDGKKVCPGAAINS